MLPENKDNLHNSLFIEQALLKCVHTLHSSENIQAAIHELLTIIGEFHDADRSYIFEFDNDEIMMHNTYEWCKEGIEPQIGLLADVEISVIDRWLSYFKSQGEFYINSLDEVLSKDSEEYRLLVLQNIESLMAAPLISNNRLVGFLGVDNPHQNTDTLLLLQSVSAFIVNDIQKLETIEHKIISALASIYISMHVINLPDNSCREITSTRQINALLNTDDDASVQMIAAMRGMIAPPGVERMLEFTDLATLPARMEGKNIISQEFFSINSIWCRANFIVVSRNEDNLPETVIFAVQQIDEAKRRELEYQNALRIALENQNEMYTEILHLQSSGIMAVRTGDNHLMAMNSAALKLFGYTSTDEFNNDIHAIIAKIESDHKEEILETIHSLSINDKPYVNEWAVRQPDGEYRYIMSHIKIVMLSGGSQIWINSLTDITDKKKMENELMRVSETDALTGIRNRGSGESSIEKLLSDGVKGMFCLFDVDKFKAVNDTYGHAVGDKVLIALADCLKHTFRNSDIIMRLGGDEYAVYAVGIDSEELGRECIIRFLHQVDSIDIEEMNDRKVSVSLGAVLCTGDGRIAFDELYQKADSAMYICKNNRGNHYRFYQA